ncbi:MAG: TRAP transporter substrate-binding protein [Armatimonadota bacterium]|nr:TRAP transporter substrate-binding protein [Armatimonadota bacterium]MDR7450634.1 TRAP transporter substrate-binding protein [Armatimonadota bacterium]MDR7466233.1 TRAP transporter substrate-binding protein [Armatimonadota bacterium]MDR7492954.1 TRAP transporter substrate-binding protein [Armatimonadota bacterium]MDR7498289.1 TRAP transporter substrate-binding protein [Armatimonadota bacterium]
MRTPQARSRVVLGALLVVAIAWGLAASGSAAPITVFRLTYATSLGRDSAYYKGAVALSEAARQLSRGRLQVRVIPDGQLGTDRDMIEGMQLGSIDLASPSTGAMGAVLPAATVLDLPYLFDGFEHVYRVLDGPLAERLYRLFDGIGFHPLGWWEIGFRNLTNNVRPVRVPADVRGLKLRTLPAAVHQRAWSLVGAQPVAMDFTEVYNALSTGVVDGQENPLNIIITGKLYEVQKHLSLTRHIYGAAPTSVSDKTWARLPPDLQQALREAVRRSVTVQRKAASGDEEGQLRQLIGFGMQVVHDPDRDAFRRAMAPAWSLYVDRFGQEGQALIDAIRREASRR